MWGLDDKEKRLKKILYRAKYRGTKELDLLLGGFIEQYLGEFSLNEVDEIEKLILLADEELFNLFILRNKTCFNLSDTLMRKLNLYFLQR